MFLTSWIHVARRTVALLLVGLATHTPVRAAETNGAIAPLHKWTAEIGQLTAGDPTNPPPRGGILFVGSSSIRKWTSLEEDFPGLPAIRRGFGGSELADSAYFADRIIFPYQPRIVVLYAGDNDIARGKSPEQVAADFEDFRKLLHTRLPDTRIIYVSIKPSPARAAFHEQFKKANAMIASACAQDPLCRFVDIWKLMLDEQDQPRHELFVADKLHMNAAGYAIWQKAIMPCLAAQENGRAAKKPCP